MVEVPNELIDFIQSGKHFVVAGHEDPDGDCVGSQLALCSLLRRMGKNAVPCSAGPFKRPELKQFVQFFLPFPENREGLKVLVMDCSIRERVGDLPVDGLPAAAVDHHAHSASGGDGTHDSVPCWGDVIFLDPHAPSVTFITEKIFRALGMEPTQEEAELLLFGLLTDTGFFRHLDQTSAETFKTAARLTAAGASPKKLFGMINGGKQLNSRLLMGTILSKTRSYFNGKLLVSGETLEESTRYAMASRDSDSIYQLLQSVEGVEAIVLIREENNEECTMGLRSRDRIDVAAIAEQFGGGGHKNAAGCRTQGSLAGLEEKVIAAFKEWF